jgi:hypothetical protein
MDFILHYLPLLNVLIVPLLSAILRTSRRLDTIEFNQRRLCSKLDIDYIEGKS